eukprot:3043544-Rhodomonas_salina.1
MDKTSVEKGGGECRQSKSFARVFVRCIQESPPPAHCTPPCPDPTLPRVSKRTAPSQSVPVRLKLYQAVPPCTPHMRRPWAAAAL